MKGQKYFFSPLGGMLVHCRVTVWMLVIFTPCRNLLNNLQRIANQYIRTTFQSGPRTWQNMRTEVRERSGQNEYGHPKATFCGRTRSAMKIYESLMAAYAPLGVTWSEGAR